MAYERSPSKHRLVGVIRNVSGAVDARVTSKTGMYRTWEQTGFWTTTGVKSLYDHYQVKASGGLNVERQHSGLSDILVWPFNALAMYHCPLLFKVEDNINKSENVVSARLYILQQVMISAALPRQTAINSTWILFPSHISDIGDTDRYLWSSSLCQTDLRPVLLLRTLSGEVHVKHIF